MSNEYMSDELFEELVESIREGGDILQGQRKPSRIFVFEEPNVKQIRQQFKLSQSEFASLLGISLKTVQNWEQGRDVPQGAARVLLHVAAKHPQVIWDVVQPAIQQA